MVQLSFIRLIRPLFFIISLLLLASCGLFIPPEPAPLGVYATPTSAVDLNTTTGEIILQQDQFEPVIKATVPPIDLDALLAAEEDSDIELADLVQATNIIINIDASTIQHTISPLIYGVTGASERYLKETDIRLNSWGGPASSRYNWRAGNAWNGGLSDSYANTNLNYWGDDAAVQFIKTSKQEDAAVLFTLPTIGWVAKNNSSATCSFPINGVCTTGQAASCLRQGVAPDPYITSIPQTTDDVLAFARYLNSETEGADIFVVMHEPESWGTTHYDVHPNCTTYDEILNTYLQYAVPLHTQFPDIELAGPSTCCWPFYWDSQAGPADKDAHGNQDFLPWFLEQMQNHEIETGQRILDILDVHYTLDFSDLDAGSARLRSTSSLWDPSYEDEGEIREAIYLIPRLQELIANHYPDTKLGLGEWGFGAADSMNGALAIADTLGIFGRENLYYANHESQPPLDSPGFYAYKIFTNYNSVGGRFGDLSVPAVGSHPEYISSYAAIDSQTGNLHIILVNKLDIYTLKSINLDIIGFTPDPTVRKFTYDGPSFQGDENGIVFETFEAELHDNRFNLTVASNSIIHLILRPESDI